MEDTTMVDVVRQERRQHPRQLLGSSARVVLLAANRDFPCLCADVSAGGARLLVPAAMPVGVGHAVRLTDFSGRISPMTGLATSDPAATVVRVDRQSLLNEGVVTVGLRFQP
jgi:hypothetical protein